MSEPERFIGSRGLKAQLLASAKGDVAPAAARRRAILAAATAVVATTKAGSAMATLGTLGRLTVWKWVAVGAVGAGSVVATHAVVQKLTAGPTSVSAPAAHAQASKGPRVRRELAPEVPAPEAPPPPVAVLSPPAPVPASTELRTDGTSAVPPWRGPHLTASPAPTPAPRIPRAQPVVSGVPADVVDTHSSPSSVRAASSSHLSAEISLIDAAKRALAGGDTAEAIRQLDAYRSAFPRGTLAAEATALRIEVLARAGRREEARALLDELKASHPDSPLLESLAQIVGE
jgi:TolA-binding protein